MTTISPNTIPDSELLDATVRAARDERNTTARLLALLAEVDARRLYLGEDVAGAPALEFHHQVPFARGGAADVANISLRCRAHNKFESEHVFGPWRRDSADTTRSGPG